MVSERGLAARRVWEEFVTVCEDGGAAWPEEG